MKHLKTLDNIFFVMSLFGIIPLVLAAFDVYRQQVQDYKIVFLFSLYIGVIGSFILKKYKTKKYEQLMRKGVLESSNE